MSSTRRVLIDNATLSGVERILGTSQTLNLNYIDNDILCLEKLLTAILFSDHLIAVNDYKDQFRSKRLACFNYINFLKIDHSRYASIANKSAEFARSMAFSFEGSKPTGDVVSFFEALKIDPQLRWDIFVSSEYLTLSYLLQTPDDRAYARSIDSFFRNEETDSSLVDSRDYRGPDFGVAKHPEITDLKDLIQTLKSENARYAGIDERSALNRIVFGYGWAAERAYFYNTIAHEEEADAYLAPLRDAFCESCCRIDYPSNVAGLLDSLKLKSQETLVSILQPSGQAHFAIRLPFFTASLISRTETPNECIDLALSLRDRNEFKECRTIFHNLSHLSTSDKRKEINGILRYLERSLSKLMRQYAVSTKNGLQCSLSFGLTGPTFGVGTKIDQMFRSYKNAPFSRVFRNMAQDMLNVERLGGLHEKVCCSIRKHHEAIHPKIATNPYYMENKENAHSRPASL